jgi:hypothetical protein
VKRFGICQNCRLEIKMNRKGLIKGHWHPYIEGLRRCHGGHKTPRPGSVVSR